VGPCDNAAINMPAQANQFTIMASLLAKGDSCADRGG